MVDDDDDDDDDDKDHANAIVCLTPTELIECSAFMMLSMHNMYMHLSSSS